MMTYHLRLERISKPKHTWLKFELEKMRDSNVLETFQATIGGTFAPLTIMNNEDSDVNSTITTLNTAVTETANEIFGKHCKKKKPWITAEILDLCYKWREWKLKKEKKKIGTWRVWEIKGSERHQETISVNHKKKKKITQAGMTDIQQRDRLTAQSDIKYRGIQYRDSDCPHRKSGDWHRQ